MANYWNFTYFLDYCHKFIPITAAKAALFRFIQSKETSQREKDLLKSVKV